MNIGTKNGETRLGPFSMNVRMFSSNVAMPPVPVPMMTPMRLGSSGLCFEAGVAHRLDGRAHRELREEVVAAGFLLLDVLQRVVALDFAGEMHGQLCRNRTG